MIFVGYIADKTGIYTEKASKLNTDLLFYIITTSVIINSFISMDNTRDNLKGLGLAILCGMALHLIGAIIVAPLFRKGDDKTRVIYKFAAMYGNCGYMALPLANAVLGPKGVFFASTSVMCFNLFSFTHGIYILGATKNDGVNFKKMLINPGTIGVAIGLPLFLSGIQLPTVIDTPLSAFAGMNTPLAMLIFGTYLANTDLKTMFKDKHIYLTALIKLIVLPLIMLGLFKLLDLPQDLRTAMAITSSAPSANNTVVFAGKYDLDTGTASKTVGLVSFISIVTMPIMIALSSII